MYAGKTRYKAVKFTLEKKDTGSSARAGSLETDHGVIKTPIFMPVGTVGSVKAVPQSALINDINAEIILGNTYHLYLRPGMDTMEKAGGLRFDLCATAGEATTDLKALLQGAYWAL